jgi:NADPH:quinone reductase-like Zn-dependent oxidoreductase
MATTTMKAVVLDGPGPAGALQIRKVPVPTPSAGWALIAVKAFGLNRAELHSRLGLAEGTTWPRVLGAEAIGVIEACPGGEFAPGQQVAALAGGMGRVFDGGYAEYTCVPVSQVVPFASSLSWPTLGAIPVMLLTASGSLDVGLDGKAGQTLLVRGGTSSIGMLTAVLAKRLSMTVISTTRNPAKAKALYDIGVDHVVIDGGSVSKAVRELCPDGVDGALELVGAPTLPDTLRCVRVHGVACFTGILSDQWTIEKFYPIDYLPRGVRLTAYSGDAGDLPPTILQGFIEDVEAGQVKVPIGRVFRLEEIVEAHQAMEDGTMSGKLVVTTGL